MPNLSLFDLSGRVALVTGSSEGIGFALAEGLGAAGARIVINGRNEEKLQAARESLAGRGIAAEAVRFDVSDRRAVFDAVERVEREIGEVDILVNNAGVQRRNPFETFPEDTWREIMAINLDGVFHVTQAVGAKMIARQRGRIVNICSVASELGRATIVPYAATKGALRQLTRGLSAEWAKHNV
jgi:gluconate 5-dehydrogenase